MNSEKEVQKTIFEKSISEKLSEEEFFSILKTVAPGTNLRSGLNGILKAGKGALIAIENEFLNDLIEGGFKINSPFTPQRIIELSKMDGAIILSSDFKKILYANALLTPDNKLFSHETGTRHKAAERTAKQTGTLVIAVSERRNEITLYCKNLRYPIVDSNELLRKVNENIQMLERQREIFDSFLDKLNRLELRNYASILQATKVIQKAGIIRKISLDLQRDILELGKEGTLLKIRLKEILSGVEEESDLVIKDYTIIDLKKSRSSLEDLSYEDLNDREKILGILGYDSISQVKPLNGWRVLFKTTLSEQEVSILIKSFENLHSILNSNFGAREKILGAERAIIFDSEIEQIKASFL